MNIIDIIIMVLVLLSAVIGFWRGITREILGICSWALAAVLTYFFHGAPKPLVSFLVSNEFLKDVLSALTVFLVSLVVLTSITYTFSDAVKSSIAGGADKILGFLFGSFRGFFLISILGFGAHKFLLKNKENMPAVIAESKLIPIADTFITQLMQSVSTTKLNEWKTKVESLLSDASAKGDNAISQLSKELPIEPGPSNEK